jgi:hypothetical protein
LVIAALAGVMLCFELSDIAGYLAFHFEPPSDGVTPARLRPLDLQRDTGAAAAAIVSARLGLFGWRGIACIGASLILCIPVIQEYLGAFLRSGFVDLWRDSINDWAGPMAFAGIFGAFAGLAGRRWTGLGQKAPFITAWVFVLTLFAAGLGVLVIIKEGKFMPGVATLVRPITALGVALTASVLLGWARWRGQAA